MGYALATDDGREATTEAGREASREAGREAGREPETGREAQGDDVKSNDVFDGASTNCSFAGEDGGGGSFAGEGVATSAGRAGSVPLLAEGDFVGIPHFVSDGAPHFVSADRPHFESSGFFGGTIGTLRT